ncbi:MAG TPA: kelch repeat-containing protein, partial [Gammaproteobacteria bacterium]
MFHAVARSLCIVALLLTACGGGGGGGGGNSGNGSSGGSSGGGGGGGSSGGGGGSTSLPLNLDPQQGDYWEFLWTRETINFAQGSGTDEDIRTGRYQITLGTSTLIQGREAFPLIVSGDTGGGEFAPRWTHIAVGDDGSLLGSTDGAGLATIYNAASDEWSGGGMFVDFGSNEVAVSNGLFPGIYNQVSATMAEYAFEDARCQTILGNTICDDDSTQYSEREYYKSGIGAVGYALRIFYSSDGGGFFTSHTLNETIELIDTSFTATDGSVFSLPPWEEVDGLNTARYRHSAVALNGKIYVLGGLSSTNTVLNSMEIYDPATDAWSFGPSMPAATTRPAVAVDGRIYVPLDTGSLMVFDPATGWSPTALQPPNGPGIDMLDIAPYNDTTFGFGQVFVGASMSTILTGVIRFGGYAPSTNQWLFSGGGDQGYAELLRFSVEVVGDSMFVIGGFGQSGSLLDDRGARDNIMEFDIINGQWVTTGPGRLNLAR